VSGKPIGRTAVAVTQRFWVLHWTENDKKYTCILRTEQETNCIEAGQDRMQQKFCVEGRGT